MRVENSTFVVTGGGNGIGREVVLELLRRGAQVAAVDLSEAGLTRTIALAGDSATRLTAHAVDITDRLAVERLPDEVGAAHGPIDGVINVAGIIHRFARLQDLSLDEIERVMRVNFWGTVHVVKAFLPTLLSRPSAALVDVSSMGGLVPVPGQGAYGSSKAAVKLFTETLYGELHGTGVAVTVVFPGAVATDIVTNSGLDVTGLAAAAAEKPAKTTTPADAGRRIVDAVESGAFRVLIGADARGLDRLGRFAPRRAIDLVAGRMKTLLA